MIYFARTDQNEHPEIDYIKIGYTSGDNAKRRINQLQTASPFSIKLIGTIAGADTRHENVLHRVFDEDRINGEWFRASERLLAYIQSFATTYGEIEPPRHIESDFDDILENLSLGTEDEFIYIAFTSMCLSMVPKWKKILFQSMVFDKATREAHKTVLTLQGLGYLNLPDNLLRKFSQRLLL